ncbi:MAG: hypothetical protein HQL64_06375 [Magnetococcales bacterium]|nr:hypothetical protein [Magnetococcales bacterium]
MSRLPARRVHISGGGRQEKLRRAQHDRVRTQWWTPLLYETRVALLATPPLAPSDTNLQSMRERGSKEEATRQYVLGTARSQRRSQQSYRDECTLV